MRAGRPRGDGQRLFLELVGVGLLDHAGEDHLVDHVVAPLDRALAGAERMQDARRLRQRGKIRGLGHGEFVHRLVEIHQRRRGDAVGAEAEIDLVEIELEDLVLGVGPLDLEREQRLLDLAGERHFVGQQEVLGDLLRDGRGALRPPVAAVVLRVDNRRARHALKVEPVVVVEILVLGREEGVDHHLRHGLDRDVEPALGGVFGNQRAVGGVHAGHHRRLVVLQLRVVRQVLGEVPEQPGAGADPDQEHDRARCEQESAESQEESHGRKSIPDEPASARIYNNSGAPVRTQKSPVFMVKLRLQRPRL